jgi:hypothetical protein
MRNSVIIVLSAIVLLAEALAAHAEVGGPVTQPPVGTSSAPAGPDLRTRAAQKPALSGNSALGTSGNAVDTPTAGLNVTGRDTSTAAPGGHAESTKNGALSSPPNTVSAPDGATPRYGEPVQPDHKETTENKSPK